MWSRQLALTLSTVIPEAFASSDDTSSSSSLIEAGFTHVLLASASAALFCLIVGLALQRWMKPYVFDFQNKLEERLFLSGIAIVVLGVSYTFMPDGIRSWARPCVEVLLFGAFMVPVGVAVWYLIQDYKSEKRDALLPCLKRLPCVRKATPSANDKDDESDRASGNGDDDEGNWHVAGLGGGWTQSPCGGTSERPKEERVQRWGRASAVKFDLGRDSFLDEENT